jgi:transglutaminase superfamily protein
MILESSAASYAWPGPMTAIDGEEPLLALRDDPSAVAALVQGLVIHNAWTSRYGIDVPPEREEEVELRPAAAMLGRIRELDPAPVTEARPPDRRLVTNCRGFAVLACALLRQVGVPARARCGFGTYFEAGRFVDHWVVERWDAAGTRWVMHDTQIDSLQKEALGLDFDPADMPPGRFVTAGDAWCRCRAGEADPLRFGIHEWRGAWFVRNNVVRDAAALGKVELLPWDHWGLMDRSSELGEGPHDAFVDRVAALAAAGDGASLRPLLRHDERLRPPAWAT